MLSDNHVRLVELDLLHADADAVGASGAGRGDGEGRPLELEGGGEHLRDRHLYTSTNQCSQYLNSKQVYCITHN